MTTTSFTMRPQKMGRLAYLLLTLIPPLLILECFNLLVESGILPASRILFIIDLILWTVSIGFLGYHLIFKKNHYVEISDSTITETDWLRKKRIIRATQISAYRKNMLRETVLLNSENKKLLCVEANMDNQELFHEWLSTHHITQI